MTKVTAWAVDARKFLTALLGALSQVVELGLLHGQALHYAQVGTAVLTAVLVHVVPNGSTAVEDTGPGTTGVDADLEAAA